MQLSILVRTRSAELCRDPHAFFQASFDGTEAVAVWQMHAPPGRAKEAPAKAGSPL
uniref:Uncharacterized protein n=1 Tax=Anguilla anguilla TaxID=7936 RepID=A0A0E9XNN0_ANGAN